MSNPVSRLRSPAILLPIVLACAFLAVALKLGNAPQVIGRVQAIPIGAMVFALIMGILYLVLKAWQLHLLLGNLGIEIDWGRFALAFAVGELALTLPFGIFAQNYILSINDMAKFGRSSAATVVMLLVEVVVVLLLLAIVGIPNWPELRPIAIGFLAGLFLLVFTTLRFEGPVRNLSKRVRSRKARFMVNELVGLLSGLRQLSNGRLLLLNLLLAAAYLAALGMAFFVVGQAVSVPGITYLKALTIYAFSLAVILMLGGLLTQIGTVEVLGMGAAQALGYSLTDGLALMLGFRIVWTGVMWLLNLPVIILFFRRLRTRGQRSRTTKAYDPEKPPH